MTSDSAQQMRADLEFCSRRLIERQAEIAPGLDRSTVTIAGFGNKGRPLAFYLRDVIGKKVTVYDASPAGRASAREAGFDVYGEVAEVDKSNSVILSACQHQLEQASQFPANGVFYEEAGFFFNLPYHFNFLQDFPKWIQDNLTDIVEFVSKLPRNAQDTLMSVLRFRLSLDPAQLTAFRRPVAGMWFDVPQESHRRTYTCFLDVGAYDGDTLDAAASSGLGFTKAIAVEANERFKEAIMARSALYSEGVEYVPSAAWSKACRLNVTEHFDGMVTVSESTTGQIPARALDEIVDGPISFLKMDIEGAEGQALNGSKEILSRGTDLAIAAYHRPEDLLAIYKLVAESLDSFDSCDFRVAHYSDCIDDTIYYFLGA